MKKLIVGFGVSGRAAAKLLLSLGHRVIAVDRKAKTLLEEPGVQLVSEAEIIDLSDIDQAILSPGIPLIHPLIQDLTARGIETIGEIELAFRFLKQNRCIGITGTNGKTTTTLLVTHILNAAGKKARALGNVGEPLSAYVKERDLEEILVVELSSYQLEALQTPCLDAAVFLNLTPDHLDRYPSLEDYALAKCRIAKCLKPEGKLFVSEEVAKDWGSSLDFAAFDTPLSGREASRVNFISQEGVFKPILQNKINPRDLSIPKSGHQKLQSQALHSFSLFASISPLAGIPLMRYIQLGKPEEQNIQAAFSLTGQFGVSEDEFWRALETFRKPHHRIEYAGEWNGICFYDDSKGTNIDAVMHAVKLLTGPIILLAGGVDKGASYRPWIDIFQGKVERIVCFGEAAPKIEAELKGSFELLRVTTLKEALVAAVLRAKAPATVLLSPGCSSFDQYRNYEHRGNEFKAFVEEKIWIEERRS